MVTTFEYKGHKIEITPLAAEKALAGNVDGEPYRYWNFVQFPKYLDSREYRDAENYVFLRFIKCELDPDYLEYQKEVARLEDELENWR